MIFSIVTDGAGEHRMRADPLFAEMSAIGQVEFTVIPDEVMAILRVGHLVRNFYILYGMLDHCSIYLAQAAASHLFMIPVDSIVADGSLDNMANYRRDGFECCGGGNIVAETETFLPALDARSADDGADLHLDRRSGDAGRRTCASLLPFADRRRREQDFGKHPRELFWPVEGGVEIHSVFIHPLFTSASALPTYSRMHFANIDYGMIPRMFADSRTIKVIEDPRQAYVNNFTARRSPLRDDRETFRRCGFPGCSRLQLYGAEEPVQAASGLALPLEGLDCISRRDDGRARNQCAIDDHRTTLGE